jgi:hypothetical protein
MLASRVREVCIGEVRRVACLALAEGRHGCYLNKKHEDRVVLANYVRGWR